MANRITLTLVFTISFLTYVAPDLSVSVQLAPLVLFALLVFVKVLCSNVILDSLCSIFEPDGLLYVVLISALIIAPSMASGLDKSTNTALLVSASLILARLYMAVVPLPEVLDAFFWSGILSVGIFISLTFSELVQSAMTLARFWAFNFHPNLIAWELAGYFCVAVWKFMTGNWQVKILAGVLGLVCVPIIFLTSSRGAIVGLLVGCLLAGAVAVTRAWKEHRKKILRTGLLAGALVLGLLFLIQDLESTRDAYDVVDQVLSLSTPDRGIDSGMTGRTDTWRETLRTLSDGSWIYGRGIRSSDSLDPMIDNSYLVILYELGLLPLILITWRFLAILRGFLKGYFHATWKQERSFYLGCSLLMAVLLTTNLVERSLFAVGNPFSLLAFFLFATPASFTQLLFKRPPGDPRLSGQCANWTWSNTERSC